MIAMLPIQDKQKHY